MSVSVRVGGSVGIRAMEPSVRLSAIVSDGAAFALDGIGGVFG